MRTLWNFFWVQVWSFGKLPLGSQIFALVRLPMILIFLVALMPVLLIFELLGLNSDRKKAE